MGHPARLRILDALCVEEACVCHLEALLGYRQAYLSQQLMILREAGLVTDRRDGLRVYYSLADQHVEAMLAAVSLPEGRRNPTEPVPGCTCPHCADKVLLHPLASGSSVSRRNN